MLTKELQAGCMELVQKSGKRELRLKMRSLQVLQAVARDVIY